MESRCGESRGTVRYRCNSSPSVTFRSMDIFSVGRRSCSTHGTACQTVDSSPYILIVRNESTKQEWVVDMNGKQLPTRFGINRNADMKDDAFTATLFKCEPLSGGPGLKVVCSASASTPSSSPGIVSLFAMMTLRSRADYQVNVSVSRSTYWKASVRWTLRHTGQPRPDRWLITLTRCGSDPAVCFFLRQRTSVRTGFSVGIDC
jgi:hypothetical protein